MIVVAALTALHADDRLAAMNRDKLGVFIHWGLYSVLGDGEWVPTGNVSHFDGYYNTGLDRVKITVSSEGILPPKK